MKPVSTLSVLILLAACGPWTDMPNSVGQSRDAPWPELLPLSELIVPVGSEATGDDDADWLLARAEALRRRADVLRTPVADQDAFEALRARMKG